MNGETTEVVTPDYWLRRAERAAAEGHHGQVEALRSVADALTREGPSDLIDRARVLFNQADEESDPWVRVSLRAMAVACLRHLLRMMEGRR